MKKFPFSSSSFRRFELDLLEVRFLLARTRTRKIFAGTLGMHMIFILFFYFFVIQFSEQV